MREMLSDALVGVVYVYQIKFKQKTSDAGRCWEMLWLGGFTFSQ